MLQRCTTDESAVQNERPTDRLVLLRRFLSVHQIPVSAATFSWATRPVQFLASSSKWSAVVTVTLLRLYPQGA
jgi:hypothetical protein